MTNNRPQLSFFCKERSCRQKSKIYFYCSWPLIFAYTSAVCHPPTIPSLCLLINSQWCSLVIPRSWQMLAIRNEGRFKTLCTRTVIRYLENRPLPFKPLPDSLHSPFLLLTFRTSCENECPFLVQSFAAQTLQSVYMYVYEEQTFMFLAASLFTSREQTGLWHSGFAVGSQDHHFST